MSIVTMPNELVLKIGSYLLPKPLDLTGEPFFAWSDTLEKEGPDIAQKARDIYALSQACRQLREILLDYPSHAHVKNFRVQFIQTVLQNPDIHSLSIHQFMKWDGEINSKNLPLEDLKRDLSFSNLYLPEMSIANKSIDTLYLLNLGTYAKSLDWLLYQLQGLRILHLDFPNAKKEESEDGTNFYRQPNISFDALIAMLRKHGENIEELVLTTPYLYGEANLSNGLSESTTLKGLLSLTRLCITSFLLLGGDGSLDNEKNICKLLPSSLIELEVFYDEAHDYPFLIDNVIFDRYAHRPEWLFELLEKKKVFTPNIERLRIISTHEWHPGYSSKYAILGGKFQPDPQFWVEADGDESWEPPTELIEAFEKAQVSFGIWLHPLRKYNLVVPDGSWFGDNWEDTWYM